MRDQPPGRVAQCVVVDNADWRSQLELCSHACVVLKSASASFFTSLDSTFPPIKWTEWHEPHSERIGLKSTDLA